MIIVHRYQWLSGRDFPELRLREHGGTYRAEGGGPIHGDGWWGGRLGLSRAGPFKGDEQELPGA